MAEQNLFSFVPLCHQKHGEETDQSRVTTLQFQAQTAVLRTVLRLGETSPSQCGQVRAQLAGGSYCVLCSSIRERIVADFPKMLTDELLWLLVPPHVKILDLSRCCNVSWEGIARVIRRGARFFNTAALRQWPHLCHLDLSYCGDQFTDDCFLLPDMEEEEAGPVLEAGASVSPKRKCRPGCKLTSVDLSGCLQLTTKCIRHLTGLCGPTLQVLNIAYTSVDCSALWFLCGYSLSTAVQLAVAVDNQGACPPMQDSRLLSPELIHKILAGELHHGNQQPITIGVPDGEMDEESSTEGALGQVSLGGEDLSEERTELKSNKYIEFDSCQSEGKSSTEGATAICFEGVPDNQNHLEASTENSTLCFPDTNTEARIVAQQVNEQKENSENAACSDNTRSSMYRTNILQTVGGHCSARVSSRVHLDTDQKNSKSTFCLEESSNELDDLDIFVEEVIANSKHSLQNGAIDNQPLTQESRIPFHQSFAGRQSKNGDETFCTPIDEENSNSRDQSESIPNEIQTSNSQSESGTLNSTDQSEAVEGMSFDSISQMKDRTKSLSLDNVELIVSEKETMNGHSDVHNYSRILNSQSVTNTTLMNSSNGCYCLSPGMLPSTSRPNVSCPREANKETVKAGSCGIAAAKDSGTHECYPSASSLEDSVLKETKSDTTEAGPYGIAAAKDCGTPTSDVNATRKKDNCVLLKGDGTAPEYDGMPPRDYGLPPPQSKYAWGEEGASERPQKLKTKPRVERTFHLQSYQPNITSLDISGVNMSMDSTSVDIGNACMKAFVSANRNLRKLSLTWKEIRDETVEFIGQHAKDLRYLSMIDCDRTAPFSLAALGYNCNKLEYLDVKGMSFIGDTGLVPLVVNNPQLQTLSLAECNITDLSLDKIAKFLGDGLTCLDLSWCEEITDSGLSCVVGACRNLQQLSLRQCLSTKHTLVRLGENCRQLRSLMMSGVEGMSDGVLVSMVENLGLLEELDVSWNLDLTDLSISRVLVCCPRLRDARLAGLKRITSKPFLPIISDLARWRRCQSLLKLKEKERRVFLEEGEEQWSSDEEYEDLYIPHRSASYAPCLRDLDLEYSDSVNDDFLAEIVAVCHGTLRIRDYYGELLQPKWTGNMHFFM
ncbi:uncharacterized protein LOC118411092 [Branchiostoma floridae]|uniref:Uncharacterized protein LOC118411092 n=1 Tax=Branchiostoma floridae TaxID=7739 RepID=A0A9J7KRE6_BRAFL|nr:uncharacterized protein LOC118411092 [Branchiostoma floridae]